MSTCVDSDLLAEREAVTAKLTAAYKEATSCRDAMNRSRTRAHSELAAAERAGRIVRGDDQVKEHLGLAGLAEREAEEHQANLASIEKRIAKLERQADGVRERMLVP